MSRIRVQELKILKMAEESGIARLETVVRTEPLVAKVMGLAAVAGMAKSFGSRLKGSGRNLGRKNLYSAIAGSFVFSLFLPMLIGRSGRKNNNHSVNSK